VWLALLLCAPFVGSFLGVVIARASDGRSAFAGRSACEACGQTLHPLDLIPLLSWIGLRARCRHCRARLSAFYPLVELGAVAPVAWAAFYLSGWLLAASAVFGWMLIALAWIDWRTLRLPDTLTLTLLVFGLAAAYFFDRDAWLEHLAAAAAAFALFAAIAALYRRLRGREGLGMGDAKLVAALGAWLSWQGAASAVFIAAMLGLSVLLVLAFAGRATTASTRLPFGPFLAAGAWIVWLYGPLVLP
jgi:leader peptidase (prepilin peptidase)/N-methyltransferase